VHGSCNNAPPEERRYATIAVGFEKALAANFFAGASSPADDASNHFTCATMFLSENADKQACPWECHSYGNPMGNVP